MHIFLFIVIMLSVFFLMEGITWLTHKFIMHGFLWYLHEDHHKKGPGVFEKNDAFFLIFSIPSILCIAFGVTKNVYWLAAIGFGIMLYGLAYFIVHDVIIHQRVKFFTRSNNSYVKAIRWAHKMHHKHLEKYDGESFGMLMVAKKYWDKVRADKKEILPGILILAPKAFLVRLYKTILVATTLTARMGKSDLRLALFNYSYTSFLFQITMIGR